MLNMTTKASGTRSAPSALSTLFHGVVRISSTAAETDVPTRSNKNRAEVRPVRVMTNPSGRWASAGPGMTKRAGRAIIAVKNGSNSQTRLTKKDMGTAERQARISVRTYSYTHLRAHETRHDLVCRLLLEKKK